MVRLVLCACVLALAGCPKKQVDAPVTPAGAGCPTGSGVFLASYVTQDVGKGRSGWVVPLHAMKVEPGAVVPDYAPIDEATASASGVPAAPAGSVWLATAAGTPCRATVGGYYAAKIEGPPASISYGVELEGCPAPQNPEEAGGIVLQTQDAPTGCRFEAPQPRAVRLGTMDDKQKWQPPASERPIPPALASIIPQKDCKAPACEMLWAFGEVQVSGQVIAWSGAVNWLAVGDPAKPCSWQAERFSGFFVPTGTGAMQVTEGQETGHPLVLSAVLADAGGAKVLLAEGPGTFATYDLAGGTPKLARAVTWMLAPADAWEAVDHIGPVCEAEPVAPAPMPKNAKPKSPY
jgi:hypothetical protein